MGCRWLDGLKVYRVSPAANTIQHKVRLVDNIIDHRFIDDHSISISEVFTCDPCGNEGSFWQLRCTSHYQQQAVRCFWPIQGEQQFKMLSEHTLWIPFESFLDMRDPWSIVSKVCPWTWKSLGILCGSNAGPNASRILGALVFFDISLTDIRYYYIYIYMWFTIHMWVINERWWGCLLCNLNLTLVHKNCSRIIGSRPSSIDSAAPEIQSRATGRGGVKTSGKKFHQLSDIEDGISMGWQLWTCIDHLSSDLMWDLFKKQSINMNYICFQCLYISIYLHIPKHTHIYIYTIYW